MAVDTAQTESLHADSERMLRAMAGARERTLQLVAGCSDAQLQATHSPIMSPLVWDLAHIAAYEDLWLCHRVGGMDLLREDLAAMYDAFETPRAVRGRLELLDTAATRHYLEAVRERSRQAVAASGPDDAEICEMVLRHELQHTETMRQTMAIAGLLPAGEPPEAPAAEPAEWLEIPAGSFAIGAAATGFAYDNERPRHQVELAAYRISLRPVSNASWMHFSEGGGYERREWWSDEGWAWKEEYDIGHHPGVATAQPGAPVCHVSWFEADAFARAHGARLPTEAEWERAAAGKTGGEAGGQTGGGLQGTGAVWEWTASEFGPYPGFRAHPYREYSEVFFGKGYKVLRGGSWATHPRVATRTFRNWDLPQRRQIFAGLRLAAEAR